MVRAQTAPGSILVRRLLRPAGVRERSGVAALQPPAHLQHHASAGTIARGAVNSVPKQPALVHISLKYDTFRAENRIIKSVYQSRVLCTKHTPCFDHGGN